MEPTRRTAIVTGLLLIIATVAALLAAVFAPVLSGADLVARVSEQHGEIAAGALLYLVAAFASVGIAIALYPVLSRWSPGLAVGSVVFRTLEAAMYIAATVSLLSVASLGPQSSLAVADALVSLRDHATLAGVFAFSLGALLYYAVFLQARLVPRWLSGWGVAGVALMAAACVLALFGDQPVTGYAPLILPIAVQEMVLAVWLLAKGFDRSSARLTTLRPSEPNS